MKKAKIIWLIVAAALTIVGMLTFVVAMSVNHWDFGALATEKYETREYKIDESFTDININTAISDITLVPSTDGETRVVVSENDKIKHSITVNNGVLTINCDDTRKWYDNIGIVIGNAPKITLYMPAGEYGNLLIRSNTGKVIVPSDFGFGSADINTNTAAIEYLADTAGNVHIHSDTGSVTVMEISANNIDVEVDTGKVHIRNCDFSGTVNVEVSIGKAEIVSVDCNRFISEGDTGDIYLNLVIAADRIDIERDTGNVKFDMCDAAQIRIKTDTGDVEGSFLSDKTVIAHSDTGKVNVPATSGGRCEIETDTGNIKIEIRKD